MWKITLNIIYSLITLSRYMKKEQLLRKVLFSLLVSLLINVTEGFHFEKEKTLPWPCWAWNLAWQKGQSWFLLWQGQRWLLGMAISILWGQQLALGPGDKKFHLLLLIWGAHSILNCTLKVFCSYSPFQSELFQKKYAFDAWSGQ